MRVDADAPVAVEFENGVPSAVALHGETWRVIDQPTVLMGEVDWLHPLITHPPERRIGWRFTAQHEDAPAKVFDVIARGAGWRLCCVWD